MASRALVKTFSALAFAEGLAKTFYDVYAGKKRNKTMMCILSRVMFATDKAFRIWPHDLTRKDIHKISCRVEALKTSRFSGPKQATILISFAIGLVDDVRRHIKNKRRADALDDVLSAMRVLAWYYDRNGDRFDAYEEADQAIRAWRALENAAEN